MKKVQKDEEGKADALETEGVQVHLGDLRKEENSKKKDIIQVEEDLKTEDGNKESEKCENSKELKIVLKEEDGEKDTSESKDTKEEKVTQEMTTFKKADEKEKEHICKDLIHEDEDFTTNIAQEIKNGQQEEDVSDKMIAFTLTCTHLLLYQQYTV